MSIKQTKDPASGTSAPRVGRSPAYPGMSLPEAIDKAKILYRAQRSYAVTPQTVAESLGYKGENGASRRTLAALVHFGLLVEEGKDGIRKLKLSEEARKLSLLPDDHADTLQIIRDLALRPKIYWEMANRWPHTLPPDSELRIFLTVERHYNPDTVPGLIQDYKKTYEFAGLGDRDDDFVESLDDDDEEDLQNSGGGQDNIGGANTPLTPPADYKGTTAYTLPIAGGRVAYLHLPPDMNLKDFRMLAMSVELIKSSVLDTDENYDPQDGHDAGSAASLEPGQTNLPF